MKLRAYLDDNDISERAFAALIGTQQASVNRYCNDRVPSADIMRKIIAATDGAVTANDFFTKEDAA